MIKVMRGKEAEQLAMALLPIGLVMLANELMEQKIKEIKETEKERNCKKESEPDEDLELDSFFKEIKFPNDLFGFGDELFKKFKEERKCRQHNNSQQRNEEPI